MCAFTSKTNAPLYYTITYAVQVIGSTGLEVVTQAWGVELASEVMDRNKLYSVSTFCGLMGVFIGILLTLFPLWLGGITTAIIIIISMFFSVTYLPDNTPLGKRAFIPLIANIRSVLWNTQFNIYLLASSFMYFINTIPALLVFFIKYCMHITGDGAKTDYTIAVFLFIVMGLIAIPFMPYIVKTFGSLRSLRSSFLAAAVLGVIMFFSSYISVILFIITFGTAGLFTTIANVVLSIVNAGAVDYDELLCGKKRASSYAGIINPIRLFIQIAGTGIPLAMMSGLGFKVSNDDKDDGNSTKDATLVLRIWCCLFISVCMTCAYLVISHYKVL